MQEGPAISEPSSVQTGERSEDETPSLPGWSRPVNTSSSALLPETMAYRLKRRLLGPPLISDELTKERLGKPTALAVLSSDVMSSSAYATEQILRILIPVGGLAAFGLVTPITLVILAVLAVVTACYREVVKSYPKAGGSYVVSRDNFGPNIAQIAGAALLISYTITVAVSVAAGTDAIISAVPSLDGAAVFLSIGFVVLIAWGNLRGLREAGRIFAIPTYFFIANMAVLDHCRLGPRRIGRPRPCARGVGPAAPRPRGRGAITGRVAFLRGPGVCQWWVGHDRDRGDLQRRKRLPQASGRQRPHDVGHHEHDPGRHVPGRLGLGSIGRTRGPLARGRRR